MALRTSFLASSGRRWASWKVATASRIAFHRTIGKLSRVGSRSSLRASGSRSGRERTYDGERWSMVTCSASPAIAGTSVTAVAPLPMTTTFFPVWSRSSGQACGCTISPAKSSAPGN